MFMFPQYSLTLSEYIHFFCQFVSIKWSYFLLSTKSHFNEMSKNNIHTILCSNLIVVDEKRR